MGNKAWTEKEINILEEKYPEMGSDIPELLMVHTKRAIKTKAQNMKIKSKKHNKNAVGTKIPQDTGEVVEIVGVYSQIRTKGHQTRIDIKREDGSILYNVNSETVWAGRLFSSKKNIVYNGELMTKEKFQKTHDIPESTFQAWRRSGMSLTEIEKRAKNRKKPIQIEDHKGNKFSSISKMSKFWGINSSTLRLRLSHGWSLEKALTEPILKAIPINSKIQCKNGMTFTIIRHKKDYSKEYFYEGFFVEDPKTIVKACGSGIKKKIVTHPQMHLCKKNHGFLDTFDTQYKFTASDVDGSVWYRCNCTKCGWKEDDIMTPQMMVAHVKECHPEYYENKGHNF